MVQMPERPFTLTPEMSEEIDTELSSFRQSGGVTYFDINGPRPTTPSETEHSAFHVMNCGSTDRTLITFIEMEGYPILRMSTSGKSQDLVLNSDQVKLLLRQMTLWLTR